MPSGTKIETSETTVAGGVALWAAPRSADFLQGGAEQSGVSFVGAGAREDSTRRRLCEALGASSFDDPRQGPSEDGVTCLLGADPELDPRPHQRVGRTVATIEPLEVRAEGAEHLPILGEFVRSPGFRAVQQILDSFGPIASIHLNSHCGPGQGTLFARLYDGIRTLEALVGRLEMVDGMLVRPNAAQSPEPAHAHTDATPERLTDLTGHLGVLVRHDPRAVASISATDQATWERSVRLLGPGGVIEFDELGLAWTDAAGNPIEVREPLERAFDSACTQLAEEIRLLASGATQLPEVERSEEIFAACEAVRLSCRTRAPESTEKVRELLART